MFLNFLDRIKDQLDKGYPFVAYRHPKELVVKAIFQKDKELNFVEDFRESGFVFAPFDSEQSPVLLKKDEFLSQAYPQESSQLNDTTIFSEFEDLDKDFHLQMIEKGLDEIAEGRLDKVVLSRKIGVDTVKTPLETFHALLRKYPSAFCYIWYHPAVGLWLGATPEMLLQTENKRFKTMSLAGTKLAVGEQGPQWDKKELEEQGMVTEFIEVALADKVTSMTISDTTAVRAGNLWHLKTSVSGLIGRCGLKEIISALHPTPAVCGLPKLKAKTFILNNENYNREYYTGFLGELNFKEDLRRPEPRRNQENRVYRTVKNKTALYVNLRCLQWQEKKVMIYVGGGITNGSVPEDEWKETKHKSGTMLNVLFN